MIEGMIRKFIKDYQKTSSPVVRARYAALAGIVGIISNLILFTVKLIVGTVFRSISVTADAVNNLTDAGSSVITLVGFKISGKPADDKHPYGHARAEYITGFVVSVVILLLGFELLKTSFFKVLDPEPVSFSYITVVALAISIAVKLWQGMFYKNLGKRINSATLEATGQDSMNDVISTAAVLVSAVFAELTGLHIDGYMGMAVALFIIYAGIRLILETMNLLLGTAPDAGLVSNLENKILGYEGVLGIHDLVVHSYGGDNYFASVHVEVPTHQDILVSHDLMDIIERDVFAEFNVNLVIHMDPIVTDDERVNTLRQQVHDIISQIDSELSMHDFRVVFGKTHSNLIFDVVVPPSYKISDDNLRELIDAGIKTIDPTFNSVITIDRKYISTTH